MLDSLAVFAGGWTLEAAQAVCGSSVSSTHETHENGVLELLVRLVDKSLVVVSGQSTREGRYRLLETVRQYACAKLVET